MLYIAYLTPLLQEAQTGPEDENDAQSRGGGPPDVPPGSLTTDPTPPLPKKEECPEPELAPVACTPTMPAPWTPKTTLPPVPVLGQQAVGGNGPAAAAAAPPPPPPGGAVGDLPGVPPMPPGSLPPILDRYDPYVDTWYVVWAGTRVGVFSSWYVLHVHKD